MFKRFSFQDSPYIYIYFVEYKTRNEYYYGVMTRPYHIDTSSLKKIAEFERLELAEHTALHSTSKRFE